MQHVVQGRITRGHNARSRFLYLPFAVPAGATRINIRYSYTGMMPADEDWGGNTLDLGLFGPGGIAFGSADFRGWSGSFRASITVGACDSTPGYLPGLPPGEWNVLLGLYKIAEDGCRYQVEVDVLSGDASPATETALQPPEPAAIGPRQSAGPRWYKGDLHCHSLHSDGLSTLGQLADHAIARGLDFLAVTEHNTISHYPFLPSLAAPGFLPIPGQEVTTYAGHANVWGAPQWVDFRCDSPEKARLAADLAHQQGALISVNHPKTGGPPWGLGFGLPFDCMEVWQAPWWVSNFESLALWDSLLRQGQRITAVGGSDLHRVGAPESSAPYPLGTPTTWVYADGLTAPAVLEALRRGRAFVSAGPTGPVIEFTAESGPAWAMMGDDLPVQKGDLVHAHIRVTGANGLILRLIGPHGVVNETVIEQDRATFRFSAPPEALGAGAFPLPYLRAEVIQPPEADLTAEPGALMLEALTNPIYVKP